MSIKYVGYFWLFLFSLQSCTKSGTLGPEAVLNSYVQTALSAKTEADYKKLLDYTTGDARAELEKMKLDEFKKSFVEGDLQLVHFKIRDLRKENNGNVSMVYELVYDQNNGDKPARITNKKVVFLVQQDKQWKISATKNVKSFIEDKKDTAIP